MSRVIPTRTPLAVCVPPVLNASTEIVRCSIWIATAKNQTKLAESLVHVAIKNERVMVHRVKGVEQYIWKVIFEEHYRFFEEYNIILVNTQFQIYIAFTIYRYSF